MFRYVYAAEPVATTVNPPAVGFIENGLPGMLATAVNIVLGIGIALTVIFLILGGIQYITSKGDQKAADTARKSLTNAVIGFVVVVGAFSIRTLLASMFAIDEGGGITGVTGGTGIEL